MTKNIRPYSELDRSQAEAELEKLRKEFAELKEAGLALNMSRGKPAPAQLDLSAPMLNILKDSSDCLAEDGTDCRNYGVLDGIPEAKRLMACLLDDEAENVIVFGNSSLTVMHDTIARCLDFGCLGSAPWASLPKVKFICPVPGYDRHFTILAQFGIEMISVPMLDSGPDIDEVERICASDDAVKGIWCVPKYANPTGATYSNEVVQRLASMECAATDFRIFWDNAYCVHHLYANKAKQDQLLDIATACAKANNPDRYYKFASTSKITFPGAGISAMASSPANIAEAKKYIGAQMIGSDKLNQLRHARFLKDKETINSHMEKLGDIIRPKFELVWKRLDEELSGLEIAKWTKPRGGYFISFTGLDGSAKRTVALAKEAGVTLTSAGATYPYGKDPHDSNIRIAPTMPTLEELDRALDVFCLCVKIAALETLALY